MATNTPEGYSDDFLEQILAMPSYAGLAGSDVGSSSETTSLTAVSQLSPVNGGLQQQPLFPLGLSLDNGREDLNCAGAFAGKTVSVKFHYFTLEAYSNDHFSVCSVVYVRGQFFTVEEGLMAISLRQVNFDKVEAFQGQPTPSTAVTVPHPPAIRLRVRARRGQATDPHSIAERLRRERISERMKALQELVPSCNKTDRAAMLDEILDYVKFLRLQVKVLSMSRLGGAGAVAQLVTDIPFHAVEGNTDDNVGNQPAWEKWSNEDTEREVAKLMEEDVGAAMQFLQSKALCIMPISLAALIYPTHQPDAPTIVKPEPTVPS